MGAEGPQNRLFNLSNLSSMLIWNAVPKVAFLAYQSGQIRVDKYYV